MKFPKKNLFLLFLFCFVAWLPIFAQKGNLPAKTISALNTVVNEYTTLTADVTASSTSISVGSSVLNSNSRFTTSLAGGDLVMIIQMQGANYNAVLNGSYSLPEDSTWGYITAYNNAGKYEFKEVASINTMGANTIQFTCGLENDYTAAGHTQVIRVPRYKSLIINAASSIVPDVWNGTTGGVVSIEVLGTTTINGSIDVSGKGFRGGVKNPANPCTAACSDQTWWKYGTNENGYGEKGEGIGGNQTEYLTLQARYSKGAIANGGGGGMIWNCGGGGGANAGVIANWRGTGNPDITTNSGGTYANAWNLEWNGFAATTSSGGGRGGYASSTAKKDPYSVRPGNSTWSTTAGQTSAMRNNGGGLGGRPLDYSSGKIYMGGGGGGGHEDNGFGGVGGNGAGIIYLITYNTVTGSGQLLANGSVGANAFGTAASNGFAGQDGAGGAGGGGAVIVNTSGGISGITINANGGKGGDQIITRGTFAGAVSQAQGPGGGGGGGFVAISSGSPTISVTGGVNGTTDSPYFTNVFPPNGATKGGAGTQANTNLFPNYNYFLTAQNKTVCSGSNVTLNAAYTGTLPPSAVIGWYASETGGVALTTGNSYTATNVTTQQIVYMGICPGFYRVADTIKISTPITTGAGADVTTCPSSAVGIGAANVTGYTYAWSPASGLSSTTISNPTATVTTNSTYFLTITDAASCTKNDTVLVSLKALPTLTLSAGDSTLCPGLTTTLTAGGASTYTWSISGNSNIGTGTTLSVNSSTQTYTVTGTGANGCSAIKTIKVTQLTEPTVVVTPSSASVCPGGTVALAASGATTYLWSAGLSAASGTNVSATPSVTNTYTVTGNNGNCSNDTTFTITVIDTNKINFNPAVPSVCPGNPITVNAVSTGGTNYNWYTTTPTTLVGAGSSITVSPVANTKYSVSYLSNGCPLSDSVTVNVGATMSISINATSTNICKGSLTNLSIASVVDSAIWSGVGLSSTNGTSVMAQPTTTSLYTVTAYTGLCVGTDTITIHVGTMPLTLNTNNTTAVCPGDSVQLIAGGATTYSWHSTAELLPTNTSSIYAHPLVTSVYTLTASNAICTKDTIVTVNVKTPVHSTFNTSTQAVCLGQGATFTATGSGTNYQWLASPSTLITTGASATLTPTLPTLYYIDYLNNGCPLRDSVTVTIKALPALNITTPDSTLCPGATTVLTASGATTYTWSKSGNTNIGTSDTLTVMASTQTYTVTGIGANGCSAIKTIKVTRLTEPTIILNPSTTTICPGDTIQLSATGATSYTWASSLWLSDSTIGNPLVYPQATPTIYNLTANNATCSKDTFVTVNITNTSNVTFSNPAPSVCPGNSISLTATAAGGSNYAWYAPSNTFIANGATVSLSPTSTTLYSVFYNSNGCALGDTITVVVGSTLNVLISTSTNDSICLGESVTLTANNVTTATWNADASLNATNTVSVIATPAATTTYIVTGSAGSCAGTDTLTIFVGTLPFTLNTNNTTPICPGDNVQLIASGATNYVWSTSYGLSDSTIANPFAQPSSTTTYQLTASNLLCSIDTFVTVNILSPTPATFSPSSPTTCPGTATTVTASGGTNYYWLNSSSISLGVSNSITVTPNTTEIYTLVYQDVGCNLFDTIRVTVNPSVTLVATALDSTLCGGQSTTLMVTNATNAVWSPASSLFSASGNSVFATPTITTTYMVIDTTAGSCSDTAYILIDVLNLTVTATPSNTTICAGDTITLSAGGAATYSWSPSNALSSTTNATISAHTSSTEIYTVIGTVGTCHDTATAIVAVTTQPTVSISGSTQVCENDFIILTATSSSTNLSWSPSTYLDTSSGSSVNVSPPIGSAGSITYTVTAGSGTCTHDTSITITINPGVNVSASAYQNTICLNDTVSLFASGATNYNWISGNNLSSTTLASVIASPTTTGINTYVVQGDNGNCFNTATIYVTVVAPPSVTITPTNTTVCLGNTTTLNATGATTYTWLASSDLSGTGASVTATPSSATNNYTVIGSSGSCSDSAYVTISTETPINITATSSVVTLCKGESVTLSALGATNYSWTPSANIVAASSASTNANPTVTTTFTATGYNVVCSDTAQVTVIVNNPITLSVTTPDPTICNGSASTLTASGATVYTWIPSTNLNNTNTSVVSASPSSTITYTVIGSTNSCLDTNTISITVVSGITVSTSATPTSICEGKSSILIASGASNYTWLNSGSATPTESSVTVKPTITTTYTVVGSVTTCVDTVTIDVLVNPLPTVYAGKDQTIAIGSTADLQATGASSYQWLPPENLTCTNCANPEATPLETTTYSVIGTDNNGCINHAKVTVKVDANYEVFVPSGFTPNNDGSNDMVYARGRGVSELRFTIFNRWGEKVFETTDINVGWDGTKNGHALNNAVFVYYLKGKFYDGSEFKRKGDISLIR